MATVLRVITAQQKRARIPRCPVRQEPTNQRPALGLEETALCALWAISASRLPQNQRFAPPVPMDDCLGFRPPQVVVRRAARSARLDGIVQATEESTLWSVRLASTLQLVRLRANSAPSTTTATPRQHQKYRRVRPAKSVLTDTSVQKAQQRSLTMCTTHTRASPGTIAGTPCPPLVQQGPGSLSWAQIPKMTASLFQLATTPQPRHRLLTQTANAPAATIAQLARPLALIRLVPPSPSEPLPGQRLRITAEPVLEPATVLQTPESRSLVRLATTVGRIQSFLRLAHEAPLEPAKVFERSLTAQSAGEDAIARNWA